MFTKAGFIFMVIPIILEFILTFIPRIIYHKIKAKITTQIGLTLPRQVEVLIGRLSMGESIKISTRKDEKTVAEEVIEPTPQNVENARSAMRAAAAQYNQFENMIYHIPAIVLCLSILSFHSHNYWWVVIIVWLHLAARALFIAVYILANNEKTALLRVVCFAASICLTTAMYLIVMFSVL